MRAATSPKVGIPGLRLRPLERSDIDGWYEYLSMPHVVEHTSWNLSCADDLRPLVEEYNSDAPSSAMCFAIENIAEKSLIGTIGFHSVSAVNRTAELAYNIHPLHWGRGIATACCNAVADWGFSHQRYVRIQATALDSNDPSMRVLEKCGFTLEGKLRSFRLVRGEPRDFWLYARVAGELG